VSRAAYFTLGLALALIGCTTAQLDQTDDAIAKGCSDVLPLAKIAAFVPGIPALAATYIIAACDTADGLARLRADPASAAWLAKMKAEIDEALGRS